MEMKQLSGPSNEEMAFQVRLYNGFKGGGH